MASAKISKLSFPSVQVAINYCLTNSTGGEVSVAEFKVTTHGNNLEKILWEKL